jgi:glycosyltransferase involved in cell wall biosynthesis
MKQTQIQHPNPRVNVHVYPAPFQFQSRMLKITKSLVDAAIFAKIIIAATAGAGLPQRERIDDRREVWRIDRKLLRNSSSTPAKALRTIEWSWKVMRSLAKEPVACVNCHSLPVLPLCVLLKLAKRAKLVYDTHELETETVASHGVRKRVQKVMERLLIRFVDETIVVNDAIAGWYEREYGLPRVWTVRNVPYNQGGEVSRTSILRDKFRIPADDLIFIYLGGVFHGRGIPLLLEAFSGIGPGRHVVFIGYGELVPLVQEYASRNTNIHYHEAVPPDQVDAYARGADVGLSMIENVCLSYYLCLPNKLFEYVLSGVPVIVSDFPGMGAVIDEHECGWKAPHDAESLRELIRGIGPEDIAARRASALAARETFGWQHEERILLRAYHEMLGTVHTPPAGPEVGHRPAAAVQREMHSSRATPDTGTGDGQAAPAPQETCR